MENMWTSVEKPTIRQHRSPTFARRGKLLLEFGGCNVFSFSAKTVSRQGTGGGRTEQKIPLVLWDPLSSRLIMGTMTSIVTNSGISPISSLRPNIRTYIRGA